MYRDGKQYDEMCILARDIYIDYDIKGFPLDAVSVCKNMGISLVKYSEYPEEDRGLLKKRSMSSFYVPPTIDSPPTIFYNNNLNEVESEGNLRRNIFHELKHYACGDTEEIPEDDDLADYFGKYFLAPIPYLIVKKITNENQIMSEFGVDSTMASFIRKNIRNRIVKYGNKIFDYEKPLLHHLLGDDYNLYVSDSDERSDAN